jgi:hypothetical protein
MRRMVGYPIRLLTRPNLATPTPKIYRKGFLLSSYTRIWTFDEQFATLAEGAALVAPAIAHGIAYQQWVG